MKPAHFHFVTLFPETIDVWLKTSILGRAHQKQLFQFSTYQLRDFARQQDKYRSVDDTPYGGGGGMVFRIEPLVAAVEFIRERTREVPERPPDRLSGGHAAARLCTSRGRRGTFALRGSPHGLR